MTEFIVRSEHAIRLWVNDRLRHDIQQILMLQSRTLLETFPRTVRAAP